MTESLKPGQELDHHTLINKWQKILALIINYYRYCINNLILKRCLTIQVTFFKIKTNP